MWRLRDDRVFSRIPSQYYNLTNSINHQQKSSKQTIGHSYAKWVYIMKIFSVILLATMTASTSARRSAPSGADVNLEKMGKYIPCPWPIEYLTFAWLTSALILTSGVHHIYNVIIHQELLDGDIPTDGDCKVFPSKKATKRESMMWKKFEEEPLECIFRQGLLLMTRRRNKKSNHHRPTTTNMVHSSSLV